MLLWPDSERANEPAGREDYLVAHLRRRHVGREGRCLGAHVMQGLWFRVSCVYG